MRPRHDDGRAAPRLPGVPDGPATAVERPAAQVTVEDIEELEGSFRGSPEEAAELLELHERFAGDMPQVSGAPVRTPAGGVVPEGLLTSLAAVPRSQGETACPLPTLRRRRAAR